ncbi:3226_t:CDS:2 [Paraglomus brasilianum]|uniref:3226_t:CDS:1 n=1 Tax=Paraglomus brasilianum TaxID=144538 RepID=A0A9N9CM30_9GLOM|nr:3226_t:CDS:2 [Paraglomus brasilianum]
MNPQRIIEAQKFFQSQRGPLFLQGSPTSRGFVYLHFGMICVGLIGALHGSYKMAKGEKK